MQTFIKLVPLSKIIGESDWRFLLLIRKEIIWNKSSPTIPTKVIIDPKKNIMIIISAKIFQIIWIKILEMKRIRHLVCLLEEKKIKITNKHSSKTAIKSKIPNTNLKTNFPYSSSISEYSKTISPIKSLKPSIPSFIIWINSIAFPILVATFVAITIPRAL